MRSLAICACVMILAGAVSAVGAATLYVGPAGGTPDRPYHAMQDAINAAQAGDTILVDPATYTGTACTMLFDNISNITVRGNGGRPVLDMGSDHGVSVWGKGISTATPSASNITYDALEFIHAAAMDVAPYNDTSHNGAGIRWDGGGTLHVINCSFHNNEEGMLITSTQASDVVIENCVLHDNGYAGGSNQKHNIYAGGGGEGGLNSFTVQYSWVYNATSAHDVKAYARTVKILYNRIGDEIINGSTTPPTTGGGLGNAIDVAKGGLTYIIGNLIIKGFSASDGNVLRYGEEGPFASYSTQLYIVANTFLGQRSGGSNNFITIDSRAASTPAYVANNIFLHWNPNDNLASGSIVNNADMVNSNLWEYEHQGNNNIHMVNYTATNPYQLDVHLQTGSDAIGVGLVPGSKPLALPATGLDGFSLAAVKHYVHPTGSGLMPSCENRSDYTDAGMYALASKNNPAIIEKPIVMAGPSTPPMGAAAVVTNHPVPLTGASLMGVASDDGHCGSLLFSWGQVSGPGTVTFGDPNAIGTMASFSVPGIYTLQLTASNCGGSGSATQTVYVEQPPTITFITPTLTIPWQAPSTTADLTVTATDDGFPNSTLTYSWGQRSTPLGHIDVGFTPGNAATTTASFTGPGTYVVECNVFDGALRTQGLVTINVVDQTNNPPVVSVSSLPSYIYEGWMLNLTATASDPDAGQTLAYAWTQTAGQSQMLTGATTVNASFTVPYKSLTSRANEVLTFQFVATDNGSPVMSSTPASVSVTCYACGDIDHDQAVILSDLKLLVAAWNSTPGGGNWNPAADLDGSSSVNLGDLKLLVGNWNRSL